MFLKLKYFKYQTHNKKRYLKTTLSLFSQFLFLCLYFQIVLIIMPSLLSEAFKAHPVHLHNKHLDFTSLQELPESYTWTQQEDLPSNISFSTESVPIIDLLDPNALQLIGHACKTWGIFQVINHGISSSLIDNIEYTSRSLFSLPYEQKLKAARPPDGISGYGLARISSFFSKLMWSEGFTIVGSPLEHFLQLWPQDHLDFCEIIEEYQKEMTKLARRLMELILTSLDITIEDIKWVGPKDRPEENCAAIQLNYYPSCPDPNRAMGLAAHTDSTLITILHQNDTSGLQVLKDGTKWVTIPPIYGGLVINIGDLLHILSNGMYQSVLHRAVVNKTKNRLSVAYLYGPPSGIEISPPTKLVGPNKPPLYRSITWTDYLRTKAKYFNKALSSLKID